MTSGDGWIDVSVALRPGVVHWPDNPPFRIERVQEIERGDEATVSRLDLGAHTGTHMDAPAHFLAGAAGIDTVDLDAIVGPARVVAIEDPRAVTREELAAHAPRRGERLLFRTRNSPAAWDAGGFAAEHVSVSPDAAADLAAAGVRTVGVDYLSVGDPTTHRTLLEAGVWIIEGLDLRDVAPGDHDLVCLPLKVVDADGAPARAILRPRAR